MCHYCNNTATEQILLEWWEFTFSAWKGEFIWVILCLSFEAGCRNPALGIFGANKPPAYKKHDR